MKIKKNERKGITLIALVITIIILLILATISIQSLTNTGLFKRAQEAKNAMENAEAEQALILNEYENALSGYYTPAEISKDEIVNVELKTSLNHCENFDGITITLENISNEDKTQKYELKNGEKNHKFTVTQNEQYRIKVTDKQDEFYVFETPSETEIYTSETEKERIITMIYKETEVYLYKNGKENTELVGTFFYKKVSL